MPDTIDLTPWAQKFDKNDIAYLLHINFLLSLPQCDKNVMQFNCQTKLKDTNVPYWRGGNSFECALSKGGSSKCVQNACRGREGVKKGQKTACALYVWPLWIFQIEERGFLTLFMDVNGFGNWCRRWTLLQGLYLARCTLCISIQLF